MTDQADDSTTSIESIIWNNWGIVEVLADRRMDLREQILDALHNAMSDEEAPSATAARSIASEVRKRSAGRGVETKYVMNGSKTDDGVDTSEIEQISLGAIVVDFPTTQDGRVCLEVSASLPQQRLFGRSLEQSKQYIRQKVESRAVQLRSEHDQAEGEVGQEVVNLDDLERATGRNDIAKRTIEAAAFTSREIVADNIEEFVQEVIAIYKIYTQIPRWLAEMGD
mgnify:CR=1 FL=1